MAVFRIVCTVLLVGLCSLEAAGSAEPRNMDYLYIDAGEGDSSGGHAAIRFGEDTFHFQYFDGMLRAVREDSMQVEYQYRFLANRTVHVSSIDVSDETYDLLKDRFSHHHLVQNQQLAILDAVRADRSLVAWLLRASSAASSQSDLDTTPFELAAAGLFSRQHDVSFGSRSDPVAAVSSVVAKRLVQVYGPEFVRDKQDSIRRAIRQLNPTHWDIAGVMLDEESFPLGSYSFSSRYVDLLTIQAALETIQTGWTLRADARVTLDNAEFRLSGLQTSVLRRYAKEMETNLVRLVGSNRPDWGYPFLVGLARLIVLRESIQVGRLVFVDTFEDKAKRVEAEDIAPYRAAFRTLLNEARTDFVTQKVRFLAAQVIDEQTYSHIESTANVYRELELGLKTNRSMRVNTGNLAPLRGKAAVDAEVPELTGIQLRTVLSKATRFETAYLNKLRNLYQYDLLTRNCVSEIFRVIDAALEDHSRSVKAQDTLSKLDKIEANQLAMNESIRRLGGYVDARFLTAIPFVAANRVNATYTVHSIRELPSYRKTKLEEIYRNENGLLAYLRESNVLTSSIYKRNPDDSFFVFFTDDAIPPRPLFGAINAVAGVAQSLVGLIMLPQDGGETLLQGVKGFLVSLPELAFFNMRKGTYRFQPHDLLMSTERIIR